MGSLGNLLGAGCEAPGGGGKERPRTVRMPWGIISKVSLIGRGGGNPAWARHPSLPNFSVNPGKPEFARSWEGGRKEQLKVLPIRRGRPATIKRTKGR